MLTPEEQIAKIKEELAEVEAAYTEFKKVPTEDKLVALMTEIIDVKACCNTFGSGIAAPDTACKVPLQMLHPEGFLRPGCHAAHGLLPA